MPERSAWSAVAFSMSASLGSMFSALRMASITSSVFTRFSASGLYMAFMPSIVWPVYFM